MVAFWLGGIIADVLIPPPKSQPFEGAPGRHAKNQNRIPPGNYDDNDNERDVFIASRMVYGDFAGGMLAQTARVGVAYASTGTSVLASSPPQKFYHWVVTVGNYYHQLQADGDKYNYYTNMEMDRLVGGWDFYKIGATKFNDIAIRSAGT